VVLMLLVERYLFSAAVLSHRVPGGAQPPTTPQWGMRVCPHCGRRHVFCPCVSRRATLRVPWTHRVQLDREVSTSGHRAAYAGLGCCL